MEYLEILLSTSELPVVVALVLGVLTAIDPCPMAMNLTAIGYITKDITSSRRIVFNSLYYTLGRVVGYTLPAIVIILLLRMGLDTTPIQLFLTQYGEKILGPALIIVGVMLFWPVVNRGKHNHHDHSSEHPNGHLEAQIKPHNRWGSVLLGIIYALAFCPYTAMLYFGGLIPLASSVPMDVYLPIVYGVATSLPVILVAAVLAYSIGSLARITHSLSILNLWLKATVGILFIIVGIYYCYNGFIAAL